MVWAYLSRGPRDCSRFGVGTRDDIRQGSSTMLKPPIKADFLTCGQVFDPFQQIAPLRPLVSIRGGERGKNWRNELFSSMLTYRYRYMYVVVCTPQ